MCSSARDLRTNDGRRRRRALAPLRLPRRLRVIYSRLVAGAGNLVGLASQPHNPDPNDTQAEASLRYAVSMAIGTLGSVSGDLLVESSANKIYPLYTDVIQCANAYVDNPSNSELANALVTSATTLVQTAVEHLSNLDPA